MLPRKKWTVKNKKTNRTIFYAWNLLKLVIKSGRTLTVHYGLDVESISVSVAFFKSWSNLSIVPFECFSNLVSIFVNAISNSIASERFQRETDFYFSSIETIFKNCIAIWNLALILIWSKITINFTDHDMLVLIHKFSKVLNL